MKINARELLKSVHLSLRANRMPIKPTFFVGADKSFPGEILAESDDINLKIPKGRELAGCGLVLLPEIADGLSYDRVIKASWTALRTVTSDKAYFYSEPKAGKN